MKSGVKGFWKKQKYVIRRHKPSSLVPRVPCCTVTLLNETKIDFFKKGFFDLDDFKKSCSVEVINDDKKN